MLLPSLWAYPCNIKCVRYGNTALCVQTSYNLVRVPFVRNSCRIAEGLSGFNVTVTRVNRTFPVHIRSEYEELPYEYLAKTKKIPDYNADVRRGRGKRPAWTRPKTRFQVYDFGKPTDIVPNIIIKKSLPTLRK